MSHHLHLEPQQHHNTLPDAVGEIHVGQEHHGYLPYTVGVDQKLHVDLIVAVDVVKLDQEPHENLAVAAGVEPHDDLPDEVDVAQIGHVYLLNEDSNPVFHFFLHCFSPLTQFQISLPSFDYV